MVVSLDNLTFASLESQKGASCLLIVYLTTIKASAAYLWAVLDHQGLKSKF